jgi:hypothetical protein
MTRSLPSKNELRAQCPVNRNKTGSWILLTSEQEHNAIYFLRTKQQKIKDKFIATDGEVRLCRKMVK